MKNLVHRLEQRGWIRKDILDAVGIIKNAKKEKKHSFLHRRIYWVLLLVLAVANFAISISLIPILMVLKGFFLYLIILIIGLSFGTLLELLIRSIEHLEEHHHRFVAIFIPFIAIVSAVIIVNLSNRLSTQLGINNLNNSIIVAFVYALSLTFPYILNRWIFGIEYYSY